VRGKVDGIVGLWLAHTQTDLLALRPLSPAARTSSVAEVSPAGRLRGDEGEVLENGNLCKLVLKFCKPPHLLPEHR